MTQYEIRIVPKDTTLNDRLTYPPGALGKIVDFGYKISPTETRWPSLAGALAGLSAATMNHYVTDWSNDHPVTACNLYVLLIADTGSGKETGRTIASLLARGAGASYQEAIVSDAALHQCLTTNPNILLSKDEFGRQLENARGVTGGYTQTVITMLMSLYGQARGTLAGRRYASKKNDLPEIAYPFISVLFATTGVSLFKALDEADGEDGTLNRMLCVPGGDAKSKLLLTERQATIFGGQRSKIELPPDLERMVRRMGVGPRQPSPLNPNEQVQVSTGCVIVDGIVYSKLKKIHKLVSDKRDASPQNTKGFWSRAFEQIIRLAGTMAIADAAYDDDLPEQIQMTLRQLNYAFDFVFEVTNWMERVLSKKITITNARDSVQQAILDAIADISDRGGYPLPDRLVHQFGSYLVPAQLLSNKTKTLGRRGADVKAELETLIEAGLVVQFKDELSRGKGMYYALVSRFPLGGEA